MKSQSRIINSLKNTTIALLGQIINIVLQFVLRSVFIESIGIQYLGINGIFTNILSILSLTELGVGAALSIGMYKPLADNNVESIKAHINAYRKVYAIIGTILAVSGICIVPLLPYLIKDSNTINMLIPIYLLYLLDAVSTYFFAHFRAILSSNQQDYVNNINKNIFTFFQVIVQIICLVIYKNFLMYLIIKIIFNILANFKISITVKKMFPYLREIKTSKLTELEKNSLFNNTIGIFSQKIGFTALHATD